ncbi:MAG: hypothetical protein ACOY5W_09010 [Pseudomonadota bacterium]
MTISAYPLTWPEGWPRSAATARITARFSRGERQYSSQPGGSSWLRKKSLTVADGIVRVVEELSRLGIDRQDVVISTHVRTRLDGLPRSGEHEPEDPGAAVYWVDRDGRHRVMAIDRDDPYSPASAVAYDCDGDFLYRFDEDWTDDQIRTALSFANKAYGLGWRVGQEIKMREIRAALGIRDLPEPV